MKARAAYNARIKKQMQWEKRGYGDRVIFINECPDCNGYGIQGDYECETCGNEPDNPEGLIKVGKSWYKIYTPKY